jgi:hypothetical protein
MKHITLALTILMSSSGIAAQHSHPSHAAMDARGTKAMGFDQSLARHRFALTADGGRIEIDANDQNDVDTRNRIAKHLEDISHQFKAGDFGIPQETHAEVPPGVAAMTRLRAEIEYKFEAAPAGGRVNITARSAAAIEAVHAFLRYQIQEHRTGDPLTVRR